jgi:hypothetical protein
MYMTLSQLKALVQWQWEMVLRWDIVTTEKRG